MATTVFALDAITGAPSYTGQMLRDALSNFAGVAPVSRALGVRSGVRPGTGVRASLSGASNFTWNVAAHAGIIDAEASATAGPYMYATDGTDTGTVTAANATNPRIDILYLKINDNAQDGSGLANGVVGYLAGTPAATPAAPATPARSLLLATISVPAVGGGNPTLTWVASEFTDPPMCEAVQNTGQSIASSSSTYYVLTLDFNYINNDGMWSSGATDRFTCVTPGTYEVSGQVTFPSNATGARQAGIASDGSATPNIVQSAAAPIAALCTVALPARKVRLNAGDYLQLLALQNSGASMTITPGYKSTFMSVKRIGG